MKVLFLDIDGVLNSDKWFRTRKYHRGGDMMNEVDPYRVALLHRILEATGAQVVLSTAWRLNPESLAAAIRISLPHYCGIVPEGKRGELRSDEIRQWIDTCGEVERYAILDDEYEAGLGHGDNFFKTNWFGDGLTEEIAGAVVGHLGPKET